LSSGYQKKKTKLNIFGWSFLSLIELFKIRDKTAFAFEKTFKANITQFSNFLKFNYFDKFDQEFNVNVRYL
jgi:hypothetical protein